MDNKKLKEISNFFGINENKCLLILKSGISEYLKEDFGIDHLITEIYEEYKNLKSIPLFSEQEILDSSTDLLNIKIPIPVIECVYFLIHKNTIIYIGETVNLLQRLIDHSKEKTFDKLCYITTRGNDYRMILEALYIMKYKPICNISIKNLDYNLFLFRRAVRISMN